MAICDHELRCAGPVVVVVDDPNAAKGGETFNAECVRCGARAWVYWPPLRFER